MRKISTLAAVVLLALVLTGTALAANWIVLGSASAPPLQVASVSSGWVSYPLSYEVDIQGTNVGGSGKVYCENADGLYASYVTTYSGQGWHFLYMPYPNPVRCEVVYATALAYPSASSILLGVWQ